METADNRETDLVSRDEPAGQNPSAKVGKYLDHVIHVKRVAEVEEIFGKPRKTESLDDACKL